MHNQDVGEREAYAALARLVLHLADANCSAIFAPSKHWLLPNDGTAEDGMHKLIREYPQ